MSQATFSVRPSTEAEANAREKAFGRFGRCSPKLCVCWLCGARTGIRKVADHIEKHRKANWIPRDASVPKRPAVQVFAEWQQADATEAELADFNY